MVDGTVMRFGGEVSSSLDNLLLSAAHSYANTSRSEALLLDAHKLAPECLPVYFSLYKFYFYSHRLADAERVVLAALDSAARQVGITSDWRAQTASSAPWHDARSPAHFYLFSLKALAFIRLRLGRLEESAELLEKLGELDVTDTVGASVVRALANAVEE